MHQTNFSDEDTIAAIATPPGKGGIAIIRISGKGAFVALDKIFKRADNTTVLNMKSHRFYSGHIYDSNSKKVLDSVLCVLMKSPHSYTGENVVEIHSHGGYLVPKKILEVIFRNGVRPAKAGEFTLRAFFNGKMDLSQAEAVADVVTAQTDESLKQAELQLEGFLSSTVGKFKEIVLDVLAEIEAQIDFPEDEIEPMARDLIIHRIKDLTIIMEQLLATYEEGRIIKEGVYTAILGKPNVGKSSLLNKLVMKDRAIVSNFPGTTRDFIEETIDIKGIPLRLVDTAGIRSTANEIEMIGVRFARKKAEEAELIIGVLDGSEDLDQNDIDLLGMVKNRKAVLVVNKIDLPRKLSVEQLLTLAPRERIVSTSAKLGSGIEELKNAIEGLLLERRIRMEGSELIITELRHKLAFEKAKQHLLDFLKAIEIKESPEFLVIDLKAALDSLSEITGEITNEEVLDRIFSKFCIGK